MKNLLKPANINNTNNTNNTNDTNNLINNTTQCWSDRPSNVVNLTSSIPVDRTSSSETSSQEKELLDSKSQVKRTRKLPAEWRGVKLDLFINGRNKNTQPQMKLNIGVIRKIDGAQIELQASLNSSFDDSVRRGVDKTKWNTESHWIRVKQHRKELGYLVDDLRASKIGKKTKGGGTEWVAFVYRADQTWCVDILREGQIYHFELTDPLTEKQTQQGNFAATGYFGERKQPQLIDPRKEWGI